MQCRIKRSGIKLENKKQSNRLHIISDLDKTERRKKIFDPKMQDYSIQDTKMTRQNIDLNGPSNF